MRVDVLQADIDASAAWFAQRARDDESRRRKGKPVYEGPRASEFCPISFALKREGWRRVQVSLVSIFAHQLSESLPPEATQFLMDWQAGTAIQPLSFFTTPRLSESWSAQDADEAVRRRASLFKSWDPWT